MGSVITGEAVCAALSDVGAVKVWEAGRSGGVWAGVFPVNGDGVAVRVVVMPRGRGAAVTVHAFADDGSGRESARIGAPVPVLSVGDLRSVVASVAAHDPYGGCHGGYWGRRCAACAEAVARWCERLRDAGCEGVTTAQTGGGCGAIEGTFRGYYVCGTEPEDAALPTGGTMSVGLYPLGDDGTEWGDVAAEVTVAAGDDLRGILSDLADEADGYA